MKSITEIQSTIHESRRCIAGHYVALSEELNLSMRLRNSIRRQPWTWMGSALATGMFVSFFKKRRSSSFDEKKPSHSKKNSSLIKQVASFPSLFFGETTLALAAGKFLRFLFPLLQPIITQYVTQRFHPSEKEYPIVDFRP